MSTNFDSATVGYGAMQLAKPVFRMVARASKICTCNTSHILTILLSGSEKVKKNVSRKRACERRRPPRSPAGACLVRWSWLNIVWQQYILGSSQWQWHWQRKLHNYFTSRRWSLVSRHVSLCATAKPSRASNYMHWMTSTARRSDTE